MSERERRTDEATTAETAATGSKPDHIGDMDVQPRHSTAGHLDPTVRAEMPDEERGGGMAERQRDRSAGAGRGRAHDGAEVPDPRAVGGQESTARAGRELIEALEEQEPRRATPDRSASSKAVPPPNGEPSP